MLCCSYNSSGQLLEKYLSLSIILSFPVPPPTFSLQLGCQDVLCNEWESSPDLTVVVQWNSNHFILGPAGFHLPPSCPGICLSVSDKTTIFMKHTMHQDQSTVIPQKLCSSDTLCAPQEKLVWFIRREELTLTVQVLYTNKQGQALSLHPGEGIKI